MPQPSETVLFRDPDRARRDVGQLRSRLSDDLLSAVVALLRDCADPDQALNLFERLTAPVDPELIKLLERNRVLLHYILELFGQSYWLGEFIVRRPGTIQGLAVEKQLQRSWGHDDFRGDLHRMRSRESEADTAMFLAAFKKYEYVHIALRDMLGLATLAETTAELSALADVILEFALAEAESQMRARFGLGAYAGPDRKEPGFAVLALGKLGGNELNYSSDLDLFYLFDKRGSSPATREYFSRQAQVLTDLLSRATSEGPAFRVDLRLRPHGGQGELAAGLAQGLDYYLRAAHDWELQALIKVRYAAGDRALAREFISGVQHRVYNPQINFAAIDTALRSRERIDSRPKFTGLAAAHGNTVDVKLDRGGIRDIEFLVQCLQRVYGGEEEWLRSGGTLFSLQKLHDKGHLSGRDFHELTQAYVLLRGVEHRLQLQWGQQLHRLPTDPDALVVLQRAMNFGVTEATVGLLQTIQHHRTTVVGIYDRMILSEKRRGKPGAGGAPAPSAASVREMSFEQLLERIAQDSAAIHEIAGRPYPVHTRRNLHRFLASAMTGTDRYAELLRSPEAVEKAVRLFAVSDYLTELLLRHPDVIRALDSERAALLPVAEPIPGAGPSLPDVSSFDELRQDFRKSVFAIGAQDVLSPRSAFRSMRESSCLANSAIRQALAILGAEDKLVVFALGRLGTEEFDIASDADLLFLREAETDPDVARTAAEKLVQALAAYTRQGSLFAVDARLRPHGREGELVITPEQLERYLTDEAQPWEALTYAKLCFIAGRDDVVASLVARVQHCIGEIASRADFAHAVVDMRARLEKSNRYPRSFKLARGGFYDIDFIASFLMLRHSFLCSGNTLERLEHLYRRGVVGSHAFEQLRDATLLYRTTDHVIRLVTGRARPELPAAEHARKAVEELTCAILGRSKFQSLQPELSATSERVRHTFDQIVRA